jgi:uncharacterized protein (DUF58 family)
VHGRFLALLTVAVIVVALATGHVLLLRLSYVLSAVLVVSAALAWTSVRWVDLERATHSRRAEVGGLLEETFRVTNHGWVPKLWLEVQDHSDLPGHFASRVVSGVPPSRARTWSARTRCRRRGVYTLGPMSLAGGDPLGMFRLERELPQTAPFVVYPCTVPLRGLDLPTGYLSGGHVVRRRAQFATTNVRGVRDYQPGDAYGRIHWRTTARRGRLYTKEFELDPIADFWLLLDLDRSVHVGADAPATDPSEPILDWMHETPLAIEPSTEEYAVTTAASLARHFLTQGKSVGLIAYGQRRTVLPPDRGHRQLTKILSNLAVLRAAGQAGVSQVLATESPEFSRNTTLVVITPATTLRWVDALRELRHRGVSSLVVVIDASSFGTAGSSQDVLTSLRAHNIPFRMIRLGDDLAGALQRSA